MKVLAVGDIHQKSWILDKVERILDGYDHAVFVGDYADDFGAPPQDRISIWREVRDFESRHSPKVKLVIGNHDYVYLHRQHAFRYAGWDPVTQTLLNTELELKSWLNEMPWVHDIDGVLYSHAGITESWNWQDPLSPDGVMWVRPSDGYVYQSKQVFGHTPSKTCWEVQKDVWCIDTFSTYSDGSRFGDHTVLEIINGNEFNIISLDS